MSRRHELCLDDNQKSNNLCLQTKQKLPLESVMTGRLSKKKNILRYLLTPGLIRQYKSLAHKLFLYQIMGLVQEKSKTMILKSTLPWHCHIVSRWHLSFWHTSSSRHSSTPLPSSKNRRWSSQTLQLVVCIQYKNIM